MADHAAFPVFVEYDAPPSAAAMLQQRVADKLTGQTTSAHDVLYGKADASAAPDIDTDAVPGAALVYGVRATGDVFLAGVALEGEGVVYQHDAFDVEAYLDAARGGGD